MRLRRDRTKRERALRIFFATDVHGSDRCFRKFLNGAETYDADVLLLGGDVAGKGLVPVRRENGSLNATVRGEKVSVPAGERDRLYAEINMLGFYPVEMEEPEIERIAGDKPYLEGLFRREIKIQLEGWCQLAADRLKPSVRCIITPGNDDPVEIDAILEAAERVECPERTLCDLGPVLLASLGDVTPTPWDTEREYSEEELGERIAAMMDQVPEGRRTVVNFHDPPYSSGLDTAPGARREPAPGAARRPAELRAGGQQGRPRCDHEVPALRGPARAHPRVPRRAEDRPDALSEPGQRLLGRSAARRDRRSRRGRVVRRLPLHRGLGAQE